MGRYKVYKNNKLIAQFDEEKDAIEKAKEIKDCYSWIEVINTELNRSVYYWIY